MCFRPKETLEEIASDWLQESSNPFPGSLSSTTNRFNYWKRLIPEEEFLESSSR